MTTNNRSDLIQYLVGYGFSIALTLAAFGTVVYLKDVVAIGLLASIIAVCGITQIFVQIVYFLHIKKSDNDGWNVASLSFTGIILLIVIGGSGWVMYYLHMNMMPELPM